MIVPRQRADVGAAVAADLGLVAHAADADAARTSPAERPRDRLRRASVLPTPGGPTKHRIGPPRVRLQLADGEELEDPLLDLLEVVVVRVEHLARVRRGRGCPRCALSHGSDAIHSEVGADDAVLGRRLRELLQPRELAVGLLAHVLRQVERRRAARAARRSRPRRRVLSPSSSWIAFSCWRRTYSRCDHLHLGHDLATGSCEPIGDDVELAREDLASSARRRLATSTSSSSACFSSILIRSAPAIRCASADGSSRLATAICSSSGRYGTCSMMLREGLLDVADQRGRAPGPPRPRRAARRRVAIR